MKNRIGKIEIAGQIIDREAMELARQQWDGVAEPLNSLGKLEELIYTDCRNPEDTTYKAAKERSTSLLCR